MSEHWPAQILDAFASALVGAAPRGRGSSFLEVGTGSGRLTRPLAAQGVPLMGVDVSRHKLGQLTSGMTHPPLPLTQADASHLPFADASFDALVTVHVMHLVRDQARAMREFRRILRPGGVYLRRSEQSKGTELPDQIRARWEVLLAERGLVQRHGARDDNALNPQLRALGATCRPVPIAEHPWRTTPGREIERVGARSQGSAWQVPAGELEGLLCQLSSWAAGEFGGLEREVVCREEFVLHVWQF